MRMCPPSWFRLGPLLLLALSPVAAPATDVADADWARTLERIAGSVVAIEVDQARAFDTERNTSAQATGFIVDAERGLILTHPEHGPDFEEIHAAIMAALPDEEAPAGRLKIEQLRRDAMKAAERGLKIRLDDLT